MDTLVRSKVPEFITGGLVLPKRPEQVGRAAETGPMANLSQLSSRETFPSLALEVTGADSLTDQDFTNPVADLAKRYQERAVKKADALLAKYTEAKTKAEEQAAEVADKHTAHVADTGDLKTTMNAIKSTIDTSLMDPGKGNEQLNKEILEFSADKDGTIKNDLKTIAEDQDKAWDPEGNDEYSVYYRAKVGRDERCQIVVAKREPLVVQQNILMPSTLAFLAQQLGRLVQRNHFCRAFSIKDQLSVALLRIVGVQGSCPFSIRTRGVLAAVIRETAIA